VGCREWQIAVKPVRQYVITVRYNERAQLARPATSAAPLDINLLPDISKYTFYQPDVEGKSQIEQSMDKYLRGTSRGMRVLTQERQRHYESRDRVEPPKPGNNVYPSPYDARIQYICEKPCGIRNSGVRRRW